MAQYTILQRFEDHICLNNFPVANVYHIAVGIGSIINTYSIELFQNLSAFAMGTTDRDAWLVFLTYLTSEQCF